MARHQHDAHGELNFKPTELPFSMLVIYVAASGRREGLRAELRALTREQHYASGIPKVEQTAPLRHGAAAWAWGFWTLRKSEIFSSEFSKIVVHQLWL